MVWTNTSGSWNDPANWSPAIVPDGNFDVLIPSNGIPQFSGDITVNSLTNYGTIDQAGYALTVSNGFALFNGTCEGSVIQISGASQVVNAGKITGDLVQLGGSIMASNFVVQGDFIKTAGSATIWGAQVDGSFYQASGDTSMDGGLVNNITNQGGTLIGGNNVYNDSLYVGGYVYNNGVFSGRFGGYPVSYTQTTNGTLNYVPSWWDAFSVGPTGIEMNCQNGASLAGALNIDMGPILARYSPTDVFGSTLGIIVNGSAYSGSFSRITFQNLAPGMALLPIQAHIVMGFFIVPSPQFSAINFSNGQVVLQVEAACPVDSNRVVLGPVVLETSTNMHDWSVLVSNSDIGPILQFTDTNSPIAPQRFYRTRLIPDF